MEKNRLILTLIIAVLIQQAVSVSFESLYDRELKSSYGFEILKYYHADRFGN